MDDLEEEGTALDQANAPSANMVYVNCRAIKWSLTSIEAQGAKILVLLHEDPKMAFDPRAYGVAQVSPQTFEPPLVKEAA